MSAQESAAAPRAFNEAYNNRDWDAAIALTAPDVEFIHVTSGKTFRGPDGIRQFWMDGRTPFLTAASRPRP